MVFGGYRITSDYGWRIHPIDKVRRFHAGVDLVKNHKAPIKAFTPGEVLYAGTGRKGTGVGGYGKVVVIGDNTGKACVYAHLNSVSVVPGKHVTTNTVIGHQGATGNVTGSHLHFEVRKNTSPSLGWTSKQENSTIDPLNYVKGGDRVVKQLEVDGYRGTATISRWQQFCGTPQDGKISEVSLLIKAWQEFLNRYDNANLKVDGQEGPKTIKATQHFFGTIEDGFLSEPSQVIKKLQEFLNNYGQ